MTALRVQPLEERALGNRIRDARTAAGFTQEELADRLELGMGRVQISQIENGRRPVRATELRRIAQVTGTPLTTLMDDPSADSPSVTVVGTFAVTCTHCGVIATAADEDTADDLRSEHADSHT